MVTNNLCLRIIKQDIDATLGSSDKQAAQQRPGISDQALQAGADAGSRHAIAGSEYEWQRSEP